MIIGIRVKDPKTKGGRCKDKGYMITWLSNGGKRWWLMVCFELKELIVISGQNGNLFGDSWLSNISNYSLLLLLLFLLLCFLSFVQNLFVLVSFL